MRERKGTKMKTRKLLVIIIAVVTLCLLMTATAFADSETLKPTDSKSGTFTDEVDTFEYILTLNYSGNLKIDVHSEVEGNITYTCNVLEDNDSIDYKSIEKGDASYNYELAPVEYRVKFYSSTPGDFSFTTTFTKAKETYTDDNNSINAIAKSDALAFGTRVYGHIAQNDLEDWYKIVLPSSGKLTLAFSTNMERQVASLSEKDGENVLYELIDKGTKTQSLHLSKGTYYLQMSRSSGYGKYSFKPTFTKSGETYTYENNTINSVRSKKAIPFGTVIKGQIAKNDNADCYKVSIPKTGKYSIKVTGAMTRVNFYILTKDNDYEELFFHDKGTNTYKVTLKKGTHYFMFSRNDGNGNYSFKVTPTKVNLKKLTKPSKGAIKVTWYKGTGNGYQIQYSTSSTFKSGNKTKLITSNATTSKTIKSLTSKKTYYVRIRTYVTGSDGKKIYSTWSAKKSIKTL